MSIFERKGSPNWNYEFEISKRRFRGSTPIPVSRPKREAQAWERTQWLAEKAEIDSGTSVSNASHSIAETFDAYLAAQEASGYETKNARKYLDRIARFLLIDHRPPIRTMEQIDTAVMTGLRTWRSLQHKWDRPDQPKVSKATVNRSVTDVLQGVFTWLQQSKSIRLLNEPIWANHTFSEPKERTRELRDSEDAALADVFNEDYEAWRGWLLATGLRLATSITRWSEIDMDAKRVTVIGKGDVVLQFPLSTGAMAILNSRKGHHPDFVFTFVAERSYLNKMAKRYYVKGQRYPITYNGAKTYWKRRREEASEVAPSLLGGDNKLRFRIHDNRHTLGTRVLRTTGNLKIVQKLLGHADITTSAKYAHVLDEEAREGLELTERKYGGVPDPQKALGHADVAASAKYAKRKDAG